MTKRVDLSPDRSQSEPEHHFMFPPDPSTLFPFFGRLQFWLYGLAAHILSQHDSTFITNKRSMTRGDHTASLALKLRPISFLGYNVFWNLNRPLAFSLFSAWEPLAPGPVAFFDLDLVPFLLSAILRTMAQLIAVLAYISRAFLPSRWAGPRVS